MSNTQHTEDTAMSHKEKNDRDIKIRLPESAYRAACDEAAALDITLAEHLRHIITDHLFGTHRKLSLRNGQQNGRGAQER
jgi:predicted DNA binding CopG/RHH family protein